MITSVFASTISLITQLSVVPYLYVWRTVCCSQSYGGKFFGFYVDGLYRRAIYPTDLQFWLLLQNTLFITPVALKDFLHFWWGEELVGTSVEM